MTILLDEIGHLVSTVDEDELHEFAQSIGLKREWFQPGSPHYDVMSVRIRKEAIDKGAEVIKATELVKRAYWTRFCPDCNRLKLGRGPDGELICERC